jgi:hypothetical protein
VILAILTVTFTESDEILMEYSLVPGRKENYKKTLDFCHSCGQLDLPIIDEFHVMSSDHST